MTLKDYLVKVRHLANSRLLSSPIRFTTGNQSADLDSVISALTSAYFEHTANNVIVIPLVNIPKTEFRLRKDICQLLGYFSIGEDILFFTEDFVKIFDSYNHDFKLTLVDHCNLQGDSIIEKFRTGRIQVNAIIDHHEDENAFLNADPRIIMPNGSCSSLVFNYWEEKLRDKAKSEEEVKRTIKGTIPLLLGPLLIDTSNMTDKVREEDVKAFRTYQYMLEDSQDILTLVNGIANTESQTLDTQELLDLFYKSIKKAKKDLSGLSFGQVLKKDYKQFEFQTSKGNTPVKVGFSSIGKSFHWLFKRFTANELFTAMDSTLSDLKLDLLIMTSSFTKKDSHYREFSYYYMSNSSFAKDFSEIYKEASEPLKLDRNLHKKESYFDRLATSSDGEFVLLNQLNTRATRKQIVPIVKEIIREF